MMMAAAIFRKLYLCRKFAPSRSCKLCRHFSNTFSAGTDEIQPIVKALNAFRDVKLTPFRVRSCAFGFSFRYAKLDVIQHLVDRNGKIKEPSFVSYDEVELEHVSTSSVYFSSLFDKGFYRIERAVNSEVTRTQPGDNEILSAVDCLNHGFLKDLDFHYASLQDLRNPRICYEIPQARLVPLLASHMLSPLVARNKGKLSSVITSDLPDKYYMCPCQNKKCSQGLHYAHIGIGSEYLWYGKPDIILYPHGGGTCNIFVCSSTDSKNTRLIEEFIDGSEKLENGQITEEESVLRNDHIIRQVVSHAITFSIYQKYYQLKQKQLFPSVTILIPTIVMCENSFDLYFYDSENDVLLRNKGDPLPLWEDSLSGSRKSFNTSGILMLWMAVNHLSLQPALTKIQIEKLKGTCGFTNQLEGILYQRVKETLQMKNKFPEVRTELPVLDITLDPADDSECSAV